MMLMYDYDGFASGDKVISTKAVPPATPRFIKYFIKFGQSVRVYFNTNQDAESVKNSGFKINDWEYEAGLLKSIK